MSLKKLGRYDLIRVLGKGAMGIVYEGKDPNLDRRVAIKTVKVENLSEEAAAEYEARFRTEARSAARLQHPNIVSVYDSDRDGDIAFLVMEYIQGDDLKHHIDKGVRYSLDQSLKMIRDLLSALDYAHKQGIVHRDIKPANLLIEPGGRVKLTDFGVARIQDSGEATRTQGSMVGTLKYMSPEQVQGLKIDSRADLFSVGVVLYQLLTDKRPFDGDNDFSIIHQIIGHTPAAPTSFNSRLPVAIDAVVARALAKNRDDRFATARDFAAALQSAIRRAEDSTVVPPADPLRRNEGGSNINPSVVNSVMTSPSTVTQEVELVYWKDIKDSTEPEEFESFLAKFPAGIYADLARRRLRKLTGIGGGPDQTVLGGMPGTPEQDLDATRLRTSPTAPLMVPASVPLAAQVPAQPAAAGTPNEGPASESSTDFTRTIVEDRDMLVPAAAAATTAPPVEPPPAATPAPIAAPTPATTPAGTPAPAQMPAPEPAPATTFAPTPAPAPVRSIAAAGELPAAVPATYGGPPSSPAAAVKEQRRKRVAEVAPAKKSPVGLFAGIGALAVAAIAAFMMMGKSAPPKVDAAAPAASAASTTVAVPAPAPAAPVAVPVAEPAVGAAASSPTVAAAMSASMAVPVAKASAAVAKASSPRKPASAPKTKASMAAPQDTVRQAMPQAPTQREEPRPASSPPQSAQSPVDQCADKSFLSREFCLVEQCAKPGTARHPLCIKHREDVRMREDSKIRQQ